MADVAGPGRTTGVEALQHRVLDRPVWVVAGATLVMAVATLWGLGDRSIWLDEGFTYAHTRLPAGDFWSIVVEREANAVLHSVITQNLTWVSDSAWWLRLPSALAVIALVPVTYLLGRRLFHPSVGAAAAVFVTCNGFVVEYGQEGRGYALLILVSAASSFLLVRALQEDDRASWIGWVAVSCLLGYAHFFGALVLVAQAVALGVRFLARSTLITRWRPVLVGFALLAVVHLPLAAFLLFGGSKGQNDGLPAFTPVRFVGVFVRVAGNLGIPLVLLVAIPCLLAVVELWRRRRDLDEQAWSILFCVAGVAVPVLLAAAVSLVDPLFVARYFVEVIPCLAVLTAYGLTRISVPWLRLAVGAGIVVLGFAAVVVWHGQPSREDARGLVEVLAAPEPEGVEPGDAIVFDPWFARIPVEVYVGDDAALQDALDPAYPATAWGAWQPDDDPGSLDESELVADLEADRVWVVNRTGDEVALAGTSDLDVALEEAGFEPALERSLDGLRLTRFDRSG